MTLIEERSKYFNRAGQIHKESKYREIWLIFWSAIFLCLGGSQKSTTFCHKFQLLTCLKGFSVIIEGIEPIQLNININFRILLFKQLKLTVSDYFVFSNDVFNFSIVQAREYLIYKVASQVVFNIVFPSCMTCSKIRGRFVPCDQVFEAARNVFAPVAHTAILGLGLFKYMEVGTHVDSPTQVG